MNKFETHPGQPRRKMARNHANCQDIFQVFLRNFFRLIQEKILNGQLFFSDWTLRLSFQQIKFLKIKWYN